jgi:hypothetical protein
LCWVQFTHRFSAQIQKPNKKVQQLVDVINQFAIRNCKTVVYKSLLVTNMIETDGCKTCELQIANWLLTFFDDRVRANAPVYSWLQSCHQVRLFGSA